MFGLIAGAAGLAAAGVASYGAIAPDSELFGKTLHRLADPKQLALTYDDGPNDPHTLDLLDVLAKHDVKATFFLVGKHVAAKPDIARRIDAAGHFIGNHTFTHPNLFFCSAERIRRELSDCEKILQDTIGSHSNLFRPPFGARRPRVLKVAREMGLVPAMWTVTCYDWKVTTAERVERHAIRQIRGADIILMHDGGYKTMGADRAHTVAATDRIIARYKSEGFEFTAVPSEEHGQGAFTRQTASFLLERYLSNKLTTYELDRLVPDTITDREIREIFAVLEPYYACDFNHKVDDMHHLTAEQESAFRRSILFLRSGIRYRWPDSQNARDIEFKKAGDFSAWPFLDQNELRKALEGANTN